MGHRQSTYEGQIDIQNGTPKKKKFKDHNYKELVKKLKALEQQHRNNKDKETLQNQKSKATKYLTKCPKT